MNQPPPSYSPSFFVSPPRVPLLLYLHSSFQFLRTVSSVFSNERPTRLHLPLGIWSSLCLLLQKVLAEVCFWSFNKMACSVLQTSLTLGIRCIYLEMLYNLLCSVSNHGLGLKMSKKYFFLALIFQRFNICLVTSHSKKRFISIKMQLFVLEALWQLRLNCCFHCKIRFPPSLSQGFKSLCSF